MNFEKIKTDFEKRYARECEKIYFAGRCITLFSKNAMTLSGCLSIGEAMAVSKREDGRVTVQFSGSDDVLRFNTSELEGCRKEKTARILLAAKKCGVTPGGGDVFIFKNSRITDLLEPLVLGGLSAFCQNVPPKEKLLPHFENFSQNIMTLSGRRQSLTLFDGQRISWVPFFDGRYKTVISYAGKEATEREKSVSICFEEGASALKRGDAEKFGELLNKRTSIVMKKCRAKVSGALFEAACREETAGSGIMDGGGIFSLVENSRIDSFIHNVSCRYQKYFGGTPDFYVTDFVDSGIFKAEN